MADPTDTQDMTTHQVTITDETVAVFPGFADVVVTKTPNGYMVDITTGHGPEAFLPNEVLSPFAVAGEGDAEFAAAVAAAATWASKIYNANI